MNVRITKTRAALAAPFESMTQGTRLGRSGLGYDVTRGDRRRIGKHLGQVLVHP